MRHGNAEERGATELELSLLLAKERVKVLRRKVALERRTKRKEPRAHSRYILLLDRLRMLPHGLKIAEVGALLGIGYQVAANLVRDCVARGILYSPRRGTYCARDEAVRLLLLERAQRDPIGAKIDAGWSKTPGAENTELRKLLESMSNEAIHTPTPLPALPKFLEPSKALARSRRKFPKAYK